ncbi:ScbA/BarX family gamma-butyrolactone biosynthesis protein [Streptomyces polygonati]|uniref:ScbA/BarX family gamma-butyrolactone biosynthesis protein n=2 Tax=Streptomyces polygonati TaxID=1617087 RepID=A0ABV8I0I1_9ACTN
MAEVPAAGPPAGTGVTAVLERTLTRTVPREYVHRSAVAEVLLTGWEQEDADLFVLQAQWPRSRVFYDAGAAGGHDPLLIAETIRQSGLLVAHAGLGVPLGHHFLMHDLSFAARPDRMAVGGVPTDITVEFRCADLKRRGGALSSLRYETVLRRGADTLATGGASFTCVTPRVYRRTRGEALRTQAPPPPEPVEPAGVGRTRASDVVLSPVGAYDRWLLRVDPRHPVLFDHPVDHVPGMVLLEAARQATAAVLGRPSPTILGIAADFTRFAELDCPCLIEACRLPATGHDASGHVLVTGSQGERPVFSVQVTV